jgi:hypothetical protein
VFYALWRNWYRLFKKFIKPSNMPTTACFQYLFTFAKAYKNKKSCLTAG